MYTYWLNWVGETKDILLCPSQGSLVWTKQPPFSNTQNPAPERASSTSPPSQVVLLLWTSSTLARWRSGQVQIQEKTLWIWKQNTHQYQKNTNNHEDYDHQIITFSRSRIPTSSNRGTQQTLQPCPLRARADSFLCVVPALNCQCHWYSPPPPGEVAKVQSPKIWRFIDIHQYPSNGWTFLGCVKDSCTSPQSLMDSPALILDFTNTKWIALCEQYHRTKAPFVVAMAKVCKSCKGPRCDYLTVTSLRQLCPMLCWPGILDFWKLQK